MKFLPRLVFLLIALVLLYLPGQSAHALGWQQGPDDGSGKVIIGGSYTLKSGETLGESLIVIGGTVTLEPGSHLAGDLVVIGGVVNIGVEASLGGDVVVVGGGLNLDTATPGNVVVIGGPIELGGAAHISKDLVSVGGTLNRSPEARVDGEIINNPEAPALQLGLGRVWQPFDDFANNLGEALLMGLLAAILVVLLPEQLRRVGNAVQTQPFAASGFGVLSLITFVVLLVALILFSFLFVTLLVTVPVFIVLCVVFISASTFGWVVIGAEIGNRLSSAFHREWPLPLTAALGTFLLTVTVHGVQAIPALWLIGGLGRFLIGMVGIGAVIMTQFGTRFYIPSVAVGPKEATPSDAPQAS